MITFKTLLTSIACSTLVGMVGLSALNSSALAQEKGGGRLLKLTSVSDKPVVQKCINRLIQGKVYSAKLWQEEQMYC